MRTPAPSSSDNQRLLRYLRDLATLTGLPAVWSGGDRCSIAGSLAEVLVKVLPLDFIEVRLRGSTGQSMIETVRRSRTKQERSLEESLKQMAEKARADAATLSPGPERDALLRKARQADTASHMNDWINSPGLKPPE